MESGQFITSDTHFGHANVIQYSGRPYASVEEMDEALIEALNATVPERAVVYHLGDFAFVKPARAVEIAKRLHGTIRLVRGNHDHRLPAGFPVEWMKDYYEAKTPDGIKVVLCHYPFEVWNQVHYGAWHLHGHSHGGLRSIRPRRFDVGVDNRRIYRPRSFEEIAEEMRGWDDTPAVRVDRVP